MLHNGHPGKSFPRVSLEETHSHGTVIQGGRLPSKLRADLDISFLMVLVFRYEFSRLRELWNLVPRLKKSN